jgi:hypothetical protein
MTENKKRKSFSTLAQDIKKIRKRPLTIEEIERANKILNTPDDSSKKEQPNRKIAKPTELES